MQAEDAVQDAFQIACRKIDALEELLRRDFQRSGGDELDTNTILYITQLLADREEAAPTGRLRDAETSWRNFLLSNAAGDSAPSARARKPRPLRVLRPAIIAAVVAVFLLGSAYAAGVLDWFPHWTDEFFSFTGKTTAEIANNPATDITTMEEALAFHNAPSHVLPSYIPEGYEPDEFYYSSSPDAYTVFGCTYSNGETLIRLDYLITYVSTGSTIYTKDEGDPEVYTFGGIDHYIVTNTGKYKAIWQNEDFECSLSGFESREELIKAIHSMYD